MRRFRVALGLLALLAGCQPLPQPFAEDRPNAGSAILALKDSAGIAVAQVAGVPAPLGAGIAEAVAAALRDNDVPASTQARNRGSYTLSGTAREQTLAGARVAVELRWELRGPDGRPAGEDLQKAEISMTAWRAGDSELLAALAKTAAPRLASLLQEEGAVAADSDRSVLVQPVDGAPGDGPQSLARAMAAVLRKANVEIAESAAAKKAKHLTIAGKVSLDPPAAGKQKIKISWVLLAADGSQIGQVDQENAIRAGSLDHSWGDVAYAVAEAAAGGIVALLDHLKTVRAAS